MNNLEKEYSKFLYDRIKTKLKEYNDIELTTYVECCVKLFIHQVDLLALNWSQIDFENKKIKNMKLHKLSASNNRDIFVTKYIVDIDLIDALKELKELSDSKDKIFPNIKKYEVVEKVKELTGIFNLSTHDFRRIGVNLLNCYY